MAKQYYIIIVLELLIFVGCKESVDVYGDMDTEKQDTGKYKNAWRSK